MIRFSVSRKGSAAVVWSVTLAFGHQASSEGGCMFLQLTRPPIFTWKTCDHTHTHTRPLDTLYGAPTTIAFYSWSFPASSTSPLSSSACHGTSSGDKSHRESQIHELSPYFPFEVKRDVPLKSLTAAVPLHHRQMARHFFQEHHKPSRVLLGWMSACFGCMASFTHKMHALTLNTLVSLQTQAVKHDEECLEGEGICFLGNKYAVDAWLLTKQQHKTQTLHWGIICFTAHAHIPERSLNIRQKRQSSR